MSSPDLSCVPSSAALEVTPFEVEIGDGIGDELKVFLKHAKLPKDTFENRTEDGTFGVSKGWIEDTIEYWRDQFDWPKREQAINSFPHFKTLIKDDDGKVYDIHFVALFSAKPGALPIIFLHGWPGSFLEFLPILDLLRKKYAPESLPYNVIVLSLPGFTFSTLPDLDRGFTVKDAARTFDRLASGLGFKRYITQGGDIGSRVARIMGSTYPACRELDGYDVTNLSDKEKVRVGLQRGDDFLTKGLSYASMHGTRPSTIGTVLSSSPVALLALVGENFVAWSDETPSLDVILESITFYWVTNTFPSGIWNYRETNMPGVVEVHSNPAHHIKTYLGFSYFPREILPTPRDWVATSGNLVFSADHAKGTLRHWRGLGNFCRTSRISQPLFRTKSEDYLAL